MSVAIELDQIASRESSDDPDLYHLVCCDIDRAMCGQDVSTWEMTDGPQAGEQNCVVCVDLERAICPDCGYTPPP